MATDELDLAECVDGARRQDPDASRALVERLYPLVLRIVRGHLPSRTAEEDLTQEVFVKLFGRLDQYESRAGIPFEHWVARLTVRTCLDALRSERRRPELRWSDLSSEDAAWLEFMVSDASVAPETDAWAAREWMEKLLGQLSPDDRLVITWLDLEQRSVRDISQMTGWTATRVKVRAFRARRKLRALAEALKAKAPYERF